MVVVIAIEVGRRVSRSYWLHGLFARLDQDLFWDILILHVVVVVIFVVKS